MKPQTETLTRNATDQRSGTRGVALVITLILLALLGAASLAIVLLVSSDTMINGYYRNYRGSFYGADSGVNIIVESIANAIQTGPAGAPPASLAGAYTPYQTAPYTIGDSGSWNEQFQMVANPNGTPVLGTPTGTGCTQNPPNPNPAFNVQCNYQYPYTVTVKGFASGTEAEEITETGTINYSSFSGSSSTSAPPSFSRYGGFITNFGDCQGELVPGTMTGPFFTDGQWNFGNFSNPGYTFVNEIGEASSEVTWWGGSSRSNNSCSGQAYQSAYNAPPNHYNVPNFESGFQANQPKVQPPANTYSQAQAVLNGAGYSCTSSSCTSTPPDPGQMSTELRTVSGAAYPNSATPPSSGVYIPYYTNSSGQNVYGATGGGAAGGFFIAGNASITLTAGTDSGGNPTQTYTISQTTGGSRWGGGTTTTTTITVDPFSGSSGTTTVSSGGKTLTMTGIPSQIDPNTGMAVSNTDPSGNPVYPTMIYVNGEITGLSGTVANQAGITIATGNIANTSGMDTDINITGNITYTSSPVSIPSDTLNSNTNAGVLGIFTNGNIDLNPSSNGANLTVDASLAALSGNPDLDNATSGFETPNNSINTWTILGGRAEDQAHSVSINQGNTYYDQRFAGNFAPPWFPTAVPQPGAAGSPAVPPSATVTRTSWREISR